MMIASRFRAVYWVGFVTVSALSCYLVSQRVAAERAVLTKVERGIAGAQGEIRQLQTEMQTLARMGQIERWNADMLALSAPKASQFLDSEFQLASFAAGGAVQVMPAVVEKLAPATLPDDAPTPSPADAPQLGPRVIPASYAAPKPAIEATVQRVAYLKPAGAPAAFVPLAGVAAPASNMGSKPISATKPVASLPVASLPVAPVKVASAKPVVGASVKSAAKPSSGGLLDATALADLGRQAAAERTAARP